MPHALPYLADTQRMGGMFASAVHLPRMRRCRSPGASRPGRCSTSRGSTTSSRTASEGGPVATAGGAMGPSARRTTLLVPAVMRAWT